MLDEVDKYVIERVKERRIEMGLSQSKLAFELGLSNAFIGMVESGRHAQKYSVSQLNKIAKILDCSPQQFLPEKPI